MVYVDPKNLGYNPFWQKWCNGRASDKEREELNRLFEKYVPPGIDLILEGIIEGKIGKKLRTIIPQTNLNMVSVEAISVSVLFVLDRNAFIRENTKKMTERER